MLRGNYYCHLFQHTSWTTKTRHESHLEISNLLNVLSGMQFDSKRKFGGGVDCSTQKENKQTLYNNNRNNKMCATILLHDRHVMSPLQERPSSFHSVRAIYFFSPFTTRYKTTLNQCHLNLLLMHFSAHLDANQYFLFCQEFYPSPLKCRRFSNFMFQPRVLCIDY